KNRKLVSGMDEDHWNEQKYAEDEPSRNETSEGNARGQLAGKPRRKRFSECCDGNQSSRYHFEPRSRCAQFFQEKRNDRPKRPVRHVHEEENHQRREIFGALPESGPRSFGWLLFHRFCDIGVLVQKKNAQQRYEIHHARHDKRVPNTYRGRQDPAKERPEDRKSV